MSAKDDDSNGAQAAKRPKSDATSMPTGTPGGCTPAAPPLEEAVTSWNGDLLSLLPETELSAALSPALPAQPEGGAGGARSWEDSMVDQMFDGNEVETSCTEGLRGTALLADLIAASPAPQPPTLFSNGSDGESEDETFYPAAAADTDADALLGWSRPRSRAHSPRAPSLHTASSASMPNSEPVSKYAKFMDDCCLLEEAAKREVLAQKEAKEKETHDAEAAAISVGEEAGAAVARAQCFKPDGKYQSWVLEMGTKERNKLVGTLRLTPHEKYELIKQCRHHKQYRSKRKKAALKAAQKKAAAEAYKAGVATA